MLEKLQIYFSIIAAIAMGITCLITRTAFNDIILGMELSIIVTYIVATVIKIYLKTTVFPEEKADSEALEINEDGDDEHILQMNYNDNIDLDLDLEEGFDPITEAVTVDK